jgi:peptidoglycan/LPS O-acetylase OafA/YrhL
MASHPLSHPWFASARRSPSAAPGYRADIDGLRAIAVLSVVGFHAFPRMVRGGFVGVDVFFVISGFLISTIIINGLKTGSFTFTDFYARRVRRIFPALIVVLAACFAFGWFALLSDEYMQLGKHIAGAAGFVSNLVLWNESGYFDTSAETKPLLHAWSLGVEEQFYFLWPLLLWLAWRSRLHLAILVAAVASVSFALNVIVLRGDAVAAFYSPQTRFWELMIGSLLAYAALRRPAILDRSEQAAAGRAGLLRDAQSVLGIVLIGAGVFALNRHLNFPGFWALLPTLGAALIIAAGPTAWINRVVLSNRLLVWIGLISFPLYLWHWPLLSFARIVESDTPEGRIRLAAVAISIVLAWLTYTLIERPLRFGRRTSAGTAALVLLMGAIGGIGYYAYAKEGLEFRAVVKNYNNNKNELVRLPAADADCDRYLAPQRPAFQYCRFTDVGARETVAVIGDSHAHTAFAGIADILRARNINTVLLANTACPTFLGAEYGRTDEIKIGCKRSIDQIIDTVVSKPDIRKVFIFTRGPLYVVGTGFGEVERYVDGQHLIGPTVFKATLQATIDKLNAAGKKVFYVTENPEIGRMPVGCIARPFRLAPKDCSLDRSAVLERQKEYLEVVNATTGATVVNSLDVFCPTERCLAAADGWLLYADSNHLSVAGSRYQAARLLDRHLTPEPAEP